MQRKKILLILFIFVISLYSANSILPSTQYSKQFLNPFYRASMTSNNNFTYLLNITTLDGISQINSAIINLQVYITPTITFNIWVDSSPCNTASYTISTTFAGSGQGLITFDCSNVIKSEKVYNVTIRPTSANTGASTIWADISYINNQPDYVGNVGNVTSVKSVDNVSIFGKGKLDVHGTEYIAGETGKLFLQYLDANNEAVKNSECFLKLWYPNNTIFQNNSLMSYLDDGIYTKTFVVPSNLGVYPASATCFRPLSFDKIVQKGAV